MMNLKDSKKGYMGVGGGKKENEKGYNFIIIEIKNA